MLPNYTGGKSNFIAKMPENAALGKGQSEQGEPLSWGAGGSPARWQSAMGTASPHVWDIPAAAL